MDWSGMFFQGWDGVVRTGLVGILAYVCLVMVLRFSGKRTLAKLNAFDLVVTVALGSTLSAVVVQESVPLLDGMVALGLLVLSQYLVTAASVRWAVVARTVRSDPSLLVRDGKFCPDTMRRERITEGEILSAIRAGGGHGLEGTAAVVLESDGTLSVLGQSNTHGVGSAAGLPEV